MNWIQTRESLIEINPDFTLPENWNWRINLNEAHLNEAHLNGAYLNGAHLRGAYLSEAHLNGAYLNGADLRGAYLNEAHLHGADLHGADLSGAHLRGADLNGADLSGTCLDDNLRQLQRTFTRQCPPLKTGGRIVYRTYTSQHVGNTIYEPGYTYVAPVISADIVTDCHPGIYAASLEWMRENYRDNKLVRCYVRDGDWFISAKGAIRCKRLRVLGFIEEDK